MEAGAGGAVVVASARARAASGREMLGVLLLRLLLAAALCPGLLGTGKAPLWLLLEPILPVPARPRLLWAAP